MKYKWIDHVFIAQGAVLTKQHMISLDVFTSYVNDDCGVSVPHMSEEHAHQTHGHKTTSSEHGEKNEGEKESKAERKGISFICTVVVEANCS